VDRYEARAALTRHLDYEHRAKAWLAARTVAEAAADAAGSTEAEADAGGAGAPASIAAEPAGYMYAPRTLPAGRR
jgi:hypothetical protein